MATRKPEWTDHMDDAWMALVEKWHESREHRQSMRADIVQQMRDIAGMGYALAYAQFTQQASERVLFQLLDSAYAESKIV